MTRMAAGNAISVIGCRDRVGDATRAVRASSGGAPVPLARPRSAPGQTFSAALPPGPAFDRQKGRVTRPAAGRVVERYGQTDAKGIRSRGITIATRPGAQVVAPYDGKVIYAGPFRAYGEILIIEHGDGYHTLLAGFERIDPQVGQGLLAGEPVGVMGKATITAGARQDPRLYVEFRRDGDTMDPLVWLAPRKDEGKG